MTVELARRLIESGVPLADIEAALLLVVERGLSLTEALAEQDPGLTTRVEHELNRSELPSVLTVRASPELYARLPAGLCRRLLAVPVHVDPRSGRVDVAAVDTHNSSWRVDAIDTWLDPVPYRDDAKGPRMRVTVAAGCLSTDKGEVGVSSDGADLDSALLPTAVPAAGLVCDYSGMNGNAFALTKSVTLSASDAARLAAAVRASQLSHLDDAMTSCPMDDGSLAVLAFSYPGRADVDVAYHYTGCPSVANGHISGAPSEQLSALTHPRAAAPSSAP